MLIKIAAGHTYPHHTHITPNEVFVVAGTYWDPSVKNGRTFAAGSYLYYPPGTAPAAPLARRAAVAVAELLPYSYFPLLPVAKLVMKTVALPPAVQKQLRRQWLRQGDS